MQTKFYNPKHVSLISRHNIVDATFVKRYRGGVNPARDMIRPVHLLRYIDNAIDLL